jgi:hypothetical protein
VSAATLYLIIYSLNEVQVFYLVSTLSNACMMRKIVFAETLNVKISEDFKSFLYGAKLDMAPTAHC